MSITKYLMKLELLNKKSREGNMLAFTKRTFPDYQINWHHRVICQYLERFLRKEILRLIIVTPPRHGKSELTSRRLPPMIHGLYPNDEILSVCYNNTLAAEMTVDVQRIISSEAFEEIFPTVKITNTNESTGYKRTSNEHEILPYQHEDKLWNWYTGSYKSAGVGGSFTGRGGDWVLIDDPIKNREEADSFSFREGLWKFYSSTIRTRLEKNASILITMTRWHEDDLVGRLLKLQKEDKNADQWVIVNLPAIHNGETIAEDIRKHDEALWPDKYDIKDLQQIKSSIGSREWTALYQGSPIDEGGNIVKDDWIRFYTSKPIKFDQIIQSWDFAVKDKATSDFTVGQVWGKIGIDKYLLDQVRGRFDFPTACQKVIELAAKYPDCRKKLIEAKANGPAIIQMLRNKVSGLVEVEPRGDKVARMHAVSPEFESGHVYLPDKAICSWIGDYLTELKSFPTGVNDDQVDATTQALDSLIALDRTTQPRIRSL